jgi:hypothetical protein
MNENKQKIKEKIKECSKSIREITIIYEKMIYEMEKKIEVAENELVELDLNADERKEKYIKLIGMRKLFYDALDERDNFTNAILLLNKGSIYEYL